MEVYGRMASNAISIPAVALGAVSIEPVA